MKRRTAFIKKLPSKVRHGPYWFQFTSIPKKNEENGLSNWFVFVFWYFSVLRAIRCLKIGARVLLTTYLNMDEWGCKFVCFNVSWKFWGNNCQMMEIICRILNYLRVNALHVFFKQLKNNLKSNISSMNSC